MVVGVVVGVVVLVVDMPVILGNSCWWEAPLSLSLLYIWVWSVNIPICIHLSFFLPPGWLPTHTSSWTIFSSYPRLALSCPSHPFVLIPPIPCIEIEN